MPYRSYHPFTGDEYFDGNDSRIMFFNGRYEAEDELSYLMKDFHQSDYARIRNVSLSETVIEYTKKGNDMIYNPLQENYEEGFNAGQLAGINKGKEEAKEDSCISLLKDGSLTPEKIAQLLKMPLEKVLKLKKSIQ